MSAKQKQVRIGKTLFTAKKLAKKIDISIAGAHKRLNAFKAGVIDENEVFRAPRRVGIWAHTKGHGKILAGQLAGRCSIGKDAAIKRIHRFNRGEITEHALMAQSCEYRGLPISDRPRDGNLFKIATNGSWEERYLRPQGIVNGRESTIRPVTVNLQR